MRPVMCFEVRALCVSFPTANVITRVCSNSLPWPGASTTFRLRLFWQAVPTGDHKGFCGVNRSQSTFTLYMLHYTYIYIN